MVFKNLADYHLWAGWRMRSLLQTIDAETFDKEVAGKTIKGLVQHIVLALETLDTRLSNVIEEIPQGKISVTHIKEEPFEVDVLDFFMQYVFHTTHHRGQLAMVLRQLGYEVPGTDYLMFFAEQE
jgi:uncharacterized damage-inducible protein DinB